MLKLAKYILLASSITMSPGVSTQDPVSSAAGTVVGVELLNASGVLDDVIDTAANNANYVVFNAAVQVRMLIESFRLSAQDLMNTGFDNLDDSQQQIFENIRTSVVALEAAVEQPVESARQTVEELHQVTYDILPWSTPSILRSSPSVIGPNDRSEIIFTFRGLSLDKSNPTLFFGDNRAQRIDLKKQQAQFSVSTDLFSPLDESTKIVNGRLILTYEECSFFVFCDELHQEYEVGVLLLPKKLATIEIVYDTKAEERIYSERLFTRLFAKSTGDLTRMKCDKESQGPHDPSYFIDVDTIQPRDRQISCPFPNRGLFKGLYQKLCPGGMYTERGVRGQAGHSWQYLNKSPGGFTVEVCAQSQMHTLVKKKNGEMFVYLGWKEYKKDDVVSPRVDFNFGNNYLNWGAFVEATLPPETNSTLIKLDYFDGTSTAFSGNYEDSYIAASWNNATKQLIVRPKKPSSISEIY